MNRWSRDSASWEMHISRSFRDVLKRGNKPDRAPSCPAFPFFFALKHVFFCSNVKLKHIVLQKSLLPLALMWIDKLFQGNCFSNVKANRLFFDTNGNITFGFGLYCQSACSSGSRRHSTGKKKKKARRRSVSPQKTIGCKSRNVLVGHYRVSQKKHRLGVSSIVSGITRLSGTPELGSNSHLQRGFEGTDIHHHHHHPQGSTAHSHITLIRILWEVIPLTPPLKEVHCRHERGKTNHVYYLHLPT